MCDCIKEAQKKINELMAEHVAKFSNAVISEAATITTQALILSSGGGWRLFAPVEGRYTQGKKINKFTYQLLFNYCPFCGEAYNP